MALAFVPLCLVAGAGIDVVLADARNVHLDLQRLFEEQREVGLARTLLDDLQGMQQWVRAAPDATPASHALEHADLQQHHAAAVATFRRFGNAADPSQPEHDRAEHAVLQRIETALGSIADALAAGRRFQTMQSAVDLAQHGAAVLASTVDVEARRIGDSLDRRSERLVDFLLLLAGAGVATLCWLGILLHRRVLLPVRALIDRTTALARGEPPTRVPVPGDDELALLTRTFESMARQVHDARADLEARVEARSREVLRTARLAEIGALAAGIAHEINNPLASVATCAEGLLRDLRSGAPDPDHLRDYLQIVHKEALRTRSITERLLRLAHHEVGRRQRLSLGAELRETAPLFEHQFATAGVSLRIEADGDGPGILGDPGDWRQVLLNLLRNALDASPRGGVVTVRTHTDGDAAILEVSDEGVGFDPAHADRLFEPFFTTKPPGKGTGLGLAIVHRIVAAHGAAITATNRRPRGATFRIRAPLAPGVAGG